MFDPKSPQSLATVLRSRLRMLSDNENARTILLAFGVIAFFAVVLHYGATQTSTPACDGNWCSSPLADDAPVLSNPEEQLPLAGPAQSDDDHRQPAAGTAIDIANDTATSSVTGSVTGSLTSSAIGTTTGTAPDTAIGAATRTSIGPDALRKPAPSTKPNAPGVVMSHKTGARAHVGIAYAARFQAYIDDLENNHGARILFMGGIRPGRCSPAGMHPCGKALDVCQLRRGVVDQRCHLPPPRTLAQIASSHGLFEGGRWCNSDYGHAQLGLTAGDCGDRRTRIVRRQAAPEAEPDRKAPGVSVE